MNGQKGRGRGCMHTLPYQSMYRKPTVFPTDRERERATRSIRFKPVLEEVTVRCVLRSWGGGKEEEGRRRGILPGKNDSNAPRTRRIGQ